MRFLKFEIEMQDTLSWEVHPNVLKRDLRKKEPAKKYTLKNARKRKKKKKEKNLKKN